MPDFSDSFTATREYHLISRTGNTADTLPHIIEEDDAISRRIQYYVLSYGSGYNATVRLTGKEEEPTHNEYGEIAP